MTWLFYHESAIKLSSGETSHWFVDANKIFEDDMLRESVLDVWQDQLQGNGPYQFEGVPRGGIPWADAITRRIRHSVLAPLNSRPPEDFKRIVVDDVVTTGQSIMDLPNLWLPVSRLAVVIRSTQAFDLYNNQISYWAYLKLDDVPAWIPYE